MAVRMPLAAFALAVSVTGIALGEPLKRNASGTDLIDAIGRGAGALRGGRPNALGFLSPLLNQTNVPRGVAPETLYVCKRALSAALRRGALIG